MNIQEKIESLQNLDPDNIGSWPFVIKMMMWILAAGISGFLMYSFQLSNSLMTLELEMEKREELIEEFEGKALKSANLDRLKKQLEDMKVSFGSLVRQLPSDVEVPGLLDDISQLGIESGLEFDSIGIGNEKIVEFYAELPIQIDVYGAFHALGSFISGVAMLPRIVTLHDLSVKPEEEAGGLNMSITAKTYRYNDHEVE